MSFDGQVVCIRGPGPDKNGAYPSINIDHSIRSLPARIKPRVDEGVVDRFRLISLPKAGKNQFVIEHLHHDHDEATTGRYFLSASLRSTPEYNGTLRLLPAPRDIDLSSVNPDSPVLQGLVWTVAGDPEDLRLPAEVTCGNAVLRLEGSSENEKLEIFLWPVPAELEPSTEDQLSGQEMLDLWDIEKTKPSDGSGASGPVFGPDFPQDLSALGMISADGDALKYGARTLKTDAGSLFKANSSKFSISTVKIACVFSTLMYARVKLDRSALMERLDPEARLAYQRWIMQSVDIIKSKWYPSKEDAIHISRQLHYMLRDTMSTMIENAKRLGFEFAPLRILHQNGFYYGKDRFPRVRQTGSGPFCGAFVDHEQSAIVVAFKGTDLWDFDEALTDLAFLLSDFTSYVTYEKPGKPETKLPGRIHVGIGNGLFKQSIIDFDTYSGVATEGRPFESIMNKLLALCSSKPYSIWVTGHSLGAGYASVFHAAFLQWCTDPEHHAERYFVPRDVITFGSLRVGDQVFADGYDQLLKQRLPGDDEGNLMPNGYRRQHWRYVNGVDPVTHLPTYKVEVPGQHYIHTGLGLRIKIEDRARKYSPVRIRTDQNPGPLEKQTEEYVKGYFATVDHRPVDDLKNSKSKITQPPPRPSPGLVLSDHYAEQYWAALRSLDGADKVDSYGINYKYSFE